MANNKSILDRVLSKFVPRDGAQIVVREEDAVYSDVKGDSGLLSLLMRGRAGSFFSETPFKAERGFTEEEMVALYKAHSVVYSCVRIIASNIARIPINVRKRVGGDTSGRDSAGKRGSIILDDSEYPVSLINFPNPDMDGYNFREAVASALVLTGDAYIELVRFDENDPTSPVTAMYPWQSQRFEIKVDPKTRRVSGYGYKMSSGKEIIFPEHKILHIKLYNPDDDYYGLSPLSAAFDPVTTDRAAIRFNKSFITNGARPLGILRSKRRLSTEQSNEIREAWASTYGNGQDKGGSGRIGVLGSDTEYQDVGKSPAEMSFLDLRKLNKDEIAHIFGVPIIKLGGDVSGVRTAEANEREFYHETIQPLENKIVGALDRILLRDVPSRKNLFLESDYSGISVLIEDQLQRAEKSRRLVAHGIMTINEARAEYNLAPLDWGNGYWAPVNLTFIDKKPESGQNMGAGDEEPADAPDSAEEDDTPVPTPRKPARRSFLGEQLMQDAPETLNKK